MKEGSMRKVSNYGIAPTSEVTIYNTRGEVMMRFPAEQVMDTKHQVIPDEHRCKYCGCLLSKFDTHCASCSAPI